MDFVCDIPWISRLVPIPCSIPVVHNIPSGSCVPSHPVCWESHQPAAHPSLCQDHGNPGLSGAFSGCCTRNVPRCPCTVSGAQAESRKHGKSKGDSPGSACKHPAWRRFKSEWIKGGSTGQGEAAKPNRSDSQTSSTSQRLPVTLWISLFWC